MKFRFSEKMYSDGFSEKKLKSTCNKIKYGKVMVNVFLITLPLIDEGILEIYRYAELLQPPYRKLNQEVMVVGIAKSKNDAFSLIESIVKDVGFVDGKIPINDYFKNLNVDIDRENV